jgi:hypothetical protein
MAISSIRAARMLSSGPGGGVAIMTPLYGSTS